MTARAPLSSASRSRAGNGCLYLFLSLFAAAGLAFFVPFFGIPGARSVASLGWDEVPCRIVESSVGVHDSSEGDDTYSVDVVYEYERDGRTWRADRYSFFTGSSSGRSRKEEIVAGLPAGAPTTCWVDPADPATAVIERSPFPWIFIGCFPLIFVAVGLGGIAGVALSGRRDRREARRRRDAAAGGAVVAAHEPVAAKAPAGLTEAGLDAWAPPGPAVLEPAGSRLGRLFGLIAIAVFWNGIVGLFVWVLWRDGELGMSCVTLFLVPFVIVGLALLYSVPHQILAMWNPRPVIDLSGPLHPGARVTMGWRFHGAASRLRKLAITVEGREEATYRRGTTSTTDKRTFFSATLVDSADPLRIRQGSVGFELPGDTMHSFASAHNKVVWELKVAGDIRFWPDLADTVGLLVYPREMT